MTTWTSPDGRIIIHNGDALETLKTLPDESVNCCVTSPPYWGLRDYGVEGQLGLEQTPEEYVAKMVEVFREVRRVLKKDGTCWINLGDSYATPKDGNTQGTSTSSLHYVSPREDLRELREQSKFKKLLPPGLKPKDLVGIPWRVAFALQVDGWYLRQDIIWHKPNPMPESVTDRCTKAHEYLFLLSKLQYYYFDNEAIKEPLASEPHNPGNKKIDNGFSSGSNISNKEKVWGENGLRNKRDVWTITTSPYKEAHFATFPPELIKPCILAGCPEGGIVLDPFNGAGTTGLVSYQLDRNYIGIELNSEYIEISKARISNMVNQPRLPCCVPEMRQPELEA